MTAQLIQNAIRVKKTGEILVSRHRHDFKLVEFPDKTTFFIDGGIDYLRCGGDASMDRIERLVLTTDNTVAEAAYSAVWGVRSKSNDTDPCYRLMCELATSHLRAILQTQPQVQSTWRKHVIEYLLLSRRATELCDELDGLEPSKRKTMLGIDLLELHNLVREIGNTRLSTDLIKLNVVEV